MELAFNTLHLRTICENEGQAQLELGLELAESLKHRLADLRAAASVFDIVVGNPRKLDDAITNKMVISLYNGNRLVFSANHLKNPINENGDIDWVRVSRIKILEIGGKNND